MGFFSVLCSQETRSQFEVRIKKLSLFCSAKGTVNTIKFRTREQRNVHKNLLQLNGKEKRRRVNSISFFAQVSKNVQVIISGTVCHHIIKEIMLTPVNICAQVLN